MRLHRLELQAFLAFPGREAVDFDALNDAGLFLLTGRTGAGKTTVLDAVCFALYGNVSEERDPRSLRSHHAARDVQTEVVLEATLGGRRLRIERRPPQLRPALRGEDRLVEDQASVRLVELEADGRETVVSTRLDEAGEELRVALGMTREQFRQVVLLPQGGFQRFLHAKTEDRERLLRELFDVTRFSDVERWLKAEADRARADAAEAVRGLQDAVAAAEHSARTLGAETDAPEGWEDEPGLAADWLDRQVVVAEAQTATAVEARNEAEAVRERAEAALAAARELAERQQAHREARAALAEWEAEASAHAAARDELAAARRAAPVRAVLDALRRRERASENAASAANAALASAREAGIDVTGEPRPEDLSALADARRRDAGAAEALLETEAAVVGEEEALRGLESRVAVLAAEIEDADAAIRRLDAARPGAVEALEAARSAASRLDDLRREKDDAERRAGHAARRDALAAEVVSLRTAHSDARSAAVDAGAAYVALAQRRLDHFAAELARGLAEGEPCAVCGATAHPSPAAPPDSGLVTEDEVAAAAEAKETAERRRDELGVELQRRELAHAEEAGAAGDGAVADLRESAAVARSALEAAMRAAAGLDEAHTALEALDAEREKASTRRGEAESERAGVLAEATRRRDELVGDHARVEAARAGAPSLARRVTDLCAAAEAADTAAVALGELDRARAEREDAARAAADAARAAGFPSTEALEAAARDDETCSALEERIADWERTLAERRALAGREDLVAAAEEPAPDVAALQAVLQRAKSEEGAAQDAHSRILQRRSELRGLTGRLAEARAHAEPLLARRAQVTALADLVLARSASNRLRMTLTSYVLAARLEEVAAAATLRLQAMTDGRYTLEHADDGASGRSRGGLDLRIVDAWTGDRRAPSTLSGGETFMTSLALALGLADTVTARAGGLRLETLFVDEGFGTLDDEGTLDAVLEALDGLREGGRTVGLVSHVAELRQRIPAQVRVVRERAGSRIAPPTGEPARA